MFHTTYDSLDSGASFGADMSGLKNVPGIWYDDAFFTDDTGTVTLTEDEEAKVRELVTQSDSINSDINYDDLPAALLNIYINNEIKAGSFLENPENSFVGFLNWYSNRIQKKIEKLKSQRGKDRAAENARQVMQLMDSRKSDIVNIFKVSRLLFEAKNIFIEKYNNAVYNTKHFVDDGSGDLVVTNPEGYVAVDHGGNGIKILLNRLEFSRANFAIDKGDKFADQVNEKEFMDDEYDSDPYPPPLPVMGEDPDEIDLEIEDEDDDPVIDSDFPKTIAVVPGAFKPPHKGHLDMVRKYAEIADEVMVLISRPTRAGRKLPNGREITADDSLKIWKLLAIGLPNVDISISTHASPINAAYEFVGEEGPLNMGDKVILGCSAKDCDWKRWMGAEKYIKSGVELLTPEGTAVTPMQRRDEMPFSATDFRNALGDPGNRDEIAEFVGEENVDNVLKILGLEGKVDEMSTGVGMSGAPAPLASGSGRPRKKTTKRRNENIAIANEVIRLIKERGILR